jgi:archaemetzincin
MAAGRSKVAVLSFFRYHPNLRMHFQVWDDYYYHSKGCDYPYVTKLAQPMRLPYEVPEFSSLEKHYQAEYIRRAGKAIVHEICHVFGIDHCIHYNCLMNGTGHLVEDYAAPTFLCGICLRKLQFSIGFSVSMRYEMLKNIFATAGMKTEVKWIEKRLQYLRANDPKPVIINLV